MRWSLKSNAKGFSLIELMIVVSIVIVLAAVVIPTGFSALEKSRTARIILDVRAVETAVLDYYAEKGTWPDDQNDESGLLTTIPAGSDRAYLPKWPKGPWDDSKFNWTQSGHIITLTNTPDSVRKKVIENIGGKESGSDYVYCVK